MVERISIFQATLATIYASPFMSAALIAATYSPSTFSEPRRLVLPWIGTSLLLWIPGMISNAIAWAAIAAVGGSLTARNRHLAMGLVGGVLLIVLVDLVSRAFRSMGGGPIEMRTFIGLLIGAAFNIFMIWTVWRFGWKSNLD
jgi:hypothetical protein